MSDFHDKINSLVHKWKSHTNQIYLYVDACANIRKSALKKQRNTQKGKEIEKQVRQLEAIQPLFEEHTFSKNIEKVIQKKKLERDEFRQLMKDTSNEITQPDVDPFLEEAAVVVEKDVFELSTDETINNILIEKIRNNLNLESEIDVKTQVVFFNDFEKSIRVTEVHMASYMKLLFYKTNINNVCEYVVEYLVSQNLIDDDHVIMCHDRDAEAEIIHRIKCNEDEKNVIISTDQDVIILAFTNLKKNVLITNPVIDQGETINLTPSIIGSNFARLTLLLENNTDYFSGVDKLRLAKPLLMRLQTNGKLNVFGIKEITLRNLLKKAVIVSYKPKLKDPIPLSPEEITQINSFIDDVDLYLSLEPSFYDNSHSFPKLTMQQLYSYFLHTQ